jgi:hypothetical protein
MPTKFILTTNAVQYRKALVDWMARFGVSARAALRVQGKLLGLRLIQFTPPQRGLKQGQNRVKKDLDKIFYGVKNMDTFDTVEDGKRHSIIETVGGEAAVRIFATKDGRVYGTDRMLYRRDATFAEMSVFHQKNRDARGRVGMAGQYTRDIGRWRFLDQMAVPVATLADYIGAVQARVGRARGGWASGTQALGGEVASWIGVHARTAGAFDDNIEGAEPSFTFLNRSEWAGGSDTNRVLSNAVKTRVRDIYKAIRGEISRTGKPLA